MDGVLQIFQGLKGSVVRQHACQSRSNSGDGAKEHLRREFAAQPFQLHPAAARDHLNDCSGDRFADRRQRFEGLTASFRDNSGDGGVERGDNVGGAAIGTRSETVLSLLVEQITIFSQFFCDRHVIVT
ncbi:hypothetical protein D9M72_466400 [compost metagenome]